MRFLLLIVFFFSSYAIALENKNFLNGKNSYEKKDLNKAKIEFEKSIVVNPKNIDSYIFLSKIFFKIKNQKEEKKNLKTALLLEPKNEEALYLITKLNIDEGDFKAAEQNYKLLTTVCLMFCDKLTNIDVSLKKFKG
jgi:Tfp pilus assembly protein PilF